MEEVKLLWIGDKVSYTFKTDNNIRCIGIIEAITEHSFGTYANIDSNGIRCVLNCNNLKVEKTNEFNDEN